MAKLKHVLDLIAAADDAVDKAQPVLAEILGVPNPDADDAAAGSAEAERSRASIAVAFDLVTADTPPRRPSRSPQTVRALLAASEAALRAS